MAETPTTPPPPARKPKPPMSRLMRLSLKLVDRVTDATRRADGTVNRLALSLLDPRVPAISSPCRGVSSRDLLLDPSTRLRARLFHPSSSKPSKPAKSSSSSGSGLPVIVFFHGGGFAFLTAASAAYDAACRRIARYSNAAVLSVDYRRAPEHKFPAPYDDGLAALRFLDGDPKTHPIALDASRCYLAGDSAGGNIAHHIARRYSVSSSSFRNVRIAGLIAIQPFFGGEERTDAELRLDGASPIVSVDRADWMWRAFLPPGADRTHEAANFAHPDAVDGLESPAFPPVLLAVGGFDPLQDWQRRYGEMLNAKGKDVRVVEYPDGIHAFFLFPGFDDARDLIIRIAEFVGESAGGGSGGGSE